MPTTQSHETGETLNTIDFHFYLYSPINQRGNFQINDNVNFPFKKIVCITAPTCYKEVKNHGGDPLPLLMNENANFLLKSVVVFCDLHNSIHML